MVITGFDEWIAGWSMLPGRRDRHYNLTGGIKHTFHNVLQPTCPVCYLDMAAKFHNLYDSHQKAGTGVIVVQQYCQQDANL